jgi:polyribonucleotide nucleotidyltransferase
MFDEKKVEMEIGGRTLTLSTGKVARQAHGSVMVSYGETVILATVTRSKKPKEGIDFFPLTVEYAEKFYSVGKMPGGFYKRESKPSTNATLTARHIDRPLRPLFPEGFRNDVQVVITVLSYDGVNTPDYLGTIGASAALTISDIPFNGPIAGVVVGYKDGEYILNPSKHELEEGDIDLAVAGTKDAIMMVEAGANQVSEETMLGAIMYGHDQIKKIVTLQEELQKLVGKEKMEFEAPQYPEEIVAFLKENAEAKLKDAITSEGKKNREEAIDELEKEVIELFKESKGEEATDTLVKSAKNYYHEMVKKFVREVIVFDKSRADGRKVDEIRPINIELDLLPVPHGSALFTRGETQAIVVTTLGTKEDQQIIDGLDPESRQNFFLHYNFPPYSVGEVGRVGAPGRRELGHGALAERALRYVMPKSDVFPYTVRVVSEITESNGSSSMASVCGGSLSLMAAGVPLKSHVAGVAMGLIKEGDKFVVLSDIMGLEDHLGDMDFKVAGTRNGITALQMDIKIDGINEEIMKTALSQALAGRFHILGLMEDSIEKTRDNIAANAPRIHTLNIDIEKIAELIGPGGKTIRAIIEKTGAKIDIENDGSVAIFAENEEKLKETVALVEMQVKEVKVGEIYMGKVTKLMAFGGFMEVLPGKEGLLHVSEISHERVNKVEDVLKVGDEMEVKVIGIEKGKINLSRKALIEKPVKIEPTV